jgi:hypothetical protein
MRSPLLVIQFLEQLTINNYHAALGVYQSIELIIDIEGVEMIAQKQLWICLISLGLFFGINTNVKAVDIPTHKTQQFQKVEQPLALKAGVTLVGLGLISLELWWFLFSKTKGKKV